MEAVAKHDFNATADDELSFRKVQVLKVKSSFYLEIGLPTCILHTMLISLSNVRRIKSEIVADSGNLVG